ncbi:serine/threonine-protein kinase [Streptomyces sp. RM99]|uniref:serine/threonine-protein kinase n=1 Tax=Streptomyces sp. RM99 TaxID=2824897 RepID=UPI001B367584|nr:serine/threonine-protein kinase [Streptomyces sp. RM99]MBQ0913916.1 protein kinase [Streptomyces sp. RM99]
MNHTAEVFQPLQDDDPRAVGGYRLAARLGAGGMGRVYLSHTPGGRPVAVKVVRSELADDPTFRRRFGREVTSARKVKGAYTAELIDADADGTPPWLATLYVPGPALSDVVARSGPLPVPAVLWLMAGVAEALQAIHGAGIVHRDLKPSNVLLASDGPRVIDFGIAVAADSTAHTATGAAIGTPQFMAPEQASGGDVTEATDVFSLGQTAAFAALGRPLYGDGPAVSVLYRIVHSEPDLSGLPERLRPLIARCVAADPGERATAAEVVEWCRRELGPDAEAGAGPAVWREIAGPEVTVPPPAPAPEAAPAPTAVRTGPWTVPQPLAQQPATAQWPGAAQWPAGPYGPTVPQRPDGPQERKRRRRRAALIAAAALVAGGLGLTAAWTVLDAAWDGVRDRTRDTAASASGTPGTGTGGAPESGAPSGAAATAEPGSSSARGAAPSATSGSVADGAASGGTAAPRAHSYSALTVDAGTSIDLTTGVQREDREGDIRFDCEDTGCALESDTSVFTMMFGGPGATYDLCSLMTAGQRSHRLPLAAASAGMEICVRHRNGDIALLVVQTKSTALPELAFLRSDITVWRAEKN